MLINRLDIADPAAAGLQVCPDGRPKVIDMVECSGSGDVDTRTIRSCTETSSDGKPVITVSGTLGGSERRVPP